MSNINILDHHFYFKTQRGRIKSQPINSEVSHYHLRLLLGNKEAPRWWPLKAPYGVFASLGHKIKAWVRGVGFLMFPLEWWSSSQGLTGWGGGSNGSPGHRANRVRGICPPPWRESWEARGNWRADTERHSQVSVQVLAALEPSSHMERVLIHWISATCGSQPLARNHTVNEKAKAYLTSLQAKGPLEEPGLDPWGCISKSTFTIKINLHSTESYWKCTLSLVQNRGYQFSWQGTTLRRRGPVRVWIHCPLTCRMIEVRLPEELAWGSPTSFPWSKQLPSTSHSHLTLHQLPQSAAPKATTQRLHVASYFTKALMNPGRQLCPVYRCEHWGSET